MNTTVAGNFASLPNGTRLHYATCGRADPSRTPLVLFMHGFPEFWGAWQDVLPLMGEDVFCVAPDLRGFNLSSQPAPVAAYHPREIMTDMLQLIEVLGYEQAFVVGHDWGGAAAWQLGIHCAEVVRKLVIINSPHPIPFARDLLSDPVQQIASRYMNALRAPAAEAMCAADDHAALLAFFTGMQRPDAPWLTDERIAEYRVVWARGLTGGLNYYRVSPLSPPTTEAEAARMRALKPQDFVCRVPTLVLWGMADIALPPRLLDGLPDVVPQLRIERVERGTHWLIHEEPQFVANCVRQFFSLG
jgi:pimeloyl-ACP methyl ester carboxylesterase